MNLSARQCEFTLALAKLILHANEIGFEIKVQELNRTIETQRQYLKNGASKTMDSRHLDNLAADLILFRNGVIVPDQAAYRPLGEFWESLGGRWGGRFGLEDKPQIVRDTMLGWDPDHFEFRKEPK